MERRRLVRVFFEDRLWERADEGVRAAVLNRPSGLPADPPQPSTFDLQLAMYPTVKRCDRPGRAERF